jgi:hypothetical protein
MLLKTNINMIFCYRKFVAWFCGLSPAGIAGSNPAGGKDVSLL